MNLCFKLDTTTPVDFYRSITTKEGNVDQLKFCKKFFGDVDLFLYWKKDQLMSDNLSHLNNDEKQVFIKNRIKEYVEIMMLLSIKKNIFCYSDLLNDFNNNGVCRLYPNTPRCMIDSGDIDILRDILNTNSVFEKNDCIETINLKNKKFEDTFNKLFIINN
jgi:hypothetical protein